MAHLVWFSAGVLWAGALAVLVGQARGVRRARLWWVALLAAALAWLLGVLAVVAAARWFPLPWQGAEVWSWPHDAVSGARGWRLGEAQRPLLLLALTAVWAVLLVDAARAERVPSEGYGWAAVLGAGGLAVPAVLAATPVAWVMSWVALDAAAFVADVGRLSRPKHRNQAVWVLFLRGASWFMALGGAAAAGGTLAAAGMALWGGALALRLTVAAFQPAVVASDRPPWRVTLAAANMLATLAAVAWLHRSAAAAPGWMVWGAALLAWWGAWRWGAAGTPLRAVSAGGMALGGLALLSALAGAWQASLAWAWLAVALPVGMALAPHRGRLLWPFFAVLALPLGLLPFTPGQAAAAVWAPPFHAWMLLAWLALAASGVALGRQGMRLPADCPHATREGRAFCLFGLALWAAVVGLGWLWPPLRGVREGQGWLWGLTALGGAAVWLGMTGRGYLHTDRAEAWVARGAALTTGALFWGAYRSMGRTLRFFSLLLEGEGGVLWALVLLAMLAVLVQH